MESLVKETVGQFQILNIKYSTKDHQIVLSSRPHKFMNDGFEYSTHERRVDNPTDLYWGHYYTSYEAALKDFEGRN